MHGDVFRPPRYLELLAALVGTGVQLALLVLSVILITIAGKYLPDDMPSWLERLIQVDPLTHLGGC